MPDGLEGSPSLSTSPPPTSAVKCNSGNNLSLWQPESPAAHASLKVGIDTMPTLWKSSSNAGRPKTGHRSIRGTISGPIPIPSALEDDEFPIRSPGSGMASPTTDDEFPIRNPGTGIASPVPPDEPDTPESEEQQRQQRQEQQQEHDGSGSGSEAEAEAEAEAQPQFREDEGPELVSAAPAGPTAATITESPEDAIQDVEPEPPSESLGAAAPLSQIPPPMVSAAQASAQGIPTLPSSPQRSSFQRNFPQRAPPAAVSTHLSRRANIPSVVRESVTSDVPSAEVPQRKKSTFRSAIGRIFGRKKKTSGSEDNGRRSERMSGPLSPSQHQSQPVPSNRSREGESKRSASLPITEYDRPLRSHSIGPNDILAIESARNSLQADNSPARRRATATNNRIFVQPRRDAEWGRGLSPRPASTHGRGNRAATGGDNPGEIGRAITSDSGTSHRRRSRSLSGLEGVAGQPGARRRSDEIRYWRESYDPGFMSPLSSNPADDSENGEAGQRSALESQAAAAERSPKTPLQPFNFGNITHDMLGMKITQVASVETRLESLETRTHKLERTVDQLSYSVPGFKSPLMEVLGRGESSRAGGMSDPTSFAYTSAVPPAIPAIYQDFAAPVRSPMGPMGPMGPMSPSRPSSSRLSLETDSHSAISFGEAPTFIGSLHPPSSSATHAQSLTITAPPALTVDALNRPISISTVRGTTSMPTMGREASLGESPGSEQYALLGAQLEAERVARQNLEAQVKKLAERLNALSTTMYAMVGGPAKSRSQERLTPSSAAASPHLPSQPTFKALKALSVFETDDDDGGGEIVGVRGRQPVEGEGGGSLTEEDEDFQTPHEELLPPPHSYGAFGEELREDDEDDGGGGGGDDGGQDDPLRKKAARTLSLSQLTMGRGIRTQI